MDGLSRLDKYWLKQEISEYTADKIPHGWKLD